jgi:tRNA 2-thiouridine synthesizing protein D
MNLLIIINRRADDGTDVAWNAARLANKACEMGSTVRVFLLNDGVWNAHKSFGVAEIEAHALLKQAVARGVALRACGTCIERARIDPKDMLPEATVSVLPDLVTWIEESDRVVSF